MGYACKFGIDNQRLLNYCPPGSTGFPVSDGNCDELRARGDSLIRVPRETTEPRDPCRAINIRDHDHQFQAANTHWGGSVAWVCLRDHHGPQMYLPPTQPFMCQQFTT